MASARTTEVFRSCVNQLKEKFEPYHTGQLVWVNENDEEKRDYNLSLPPWICQPYIRMEPKKHIEYIAAKEREAAQKEKVEYFDEHGQRISKNVMKRLKKANRKLNAKEARQRPAHQICSASKCFNPPVRCYWYSILNNSDEISNRIVIYH